MKKFNGWHYDKALSSVETHDDVTICDVYQDIEINGPLFAAAPELLKALKGLLEVVDRYDIPETSLYEKGDARQAIAKAEGK